MAKKKQKREEPKRTPKKKWHSEEHLSLNEKNYTLLVIGIILIVVGFILLEMQFLTLSPILLLLGFCFFVPVSIIWGLNSKLNEKKSDKIVDKGRLAA